MCSFDGKKSTDQHRVTLRDLYCFKNKKSEIFIMSTEEQLVNCVRHTRGFIQIYFLFNLLIKFFQRKSTFKRYFKKVVISSYS